MYRHAISQQTVLVPNAPDQLQVEIIFDAQFVLNADGIVCMPKTEGVRNCKQMQLEGTVVVLVAPDALFR